VPLPLLAVVPLADGAFLWSSEASGFKHLAVHNPDGSVRTQLTSGGWAVDETSRELVDESGGTVYFAANGGDPRERHLFRVPLAGGSVRRVTREEGMHHVVPDRAFTQFVDKYHGVDAPVCATLANSRTHLRPPCAPRYRTVPHTSRRRVATGR
jgi:dipeptidyl-peptidase-4